MITTEQMDRAQAILAELGIEESQLPCPRPESGHHSSILLPCKGLDGRDFLLKYFVAPEDGKWYPPEVHLADYARREIAFYSFLDSWDCTRREMPAPKTVLLDPQDPPHWILLEYLQKGPGPESEQIGASGIFDLLARFQDLDIDRMRGRRNFPLNRWDVVSLRDRVVRLMYEPLIFIVGEEMWLRIRDFYTEAVRWCETRPQVAVHGDFTEENILVDYDGRPHLVDFERVGLGSPEHDFTLLWIHSQRSKEWKRDFFARFVESKFGSDRVRMDWSMRATAVYLACRRLRFGFLTHGDQDALRGKNLALLRAALGGGAEFFPA
jgi:aminoglycoside phosphotransferase (APT) family kinase protein